MNEYAVTFFLPYGTVTVEFQSAVKFVTEANQEELAEAASKIFRGAYGLDLLLFAQDFSIDVVYEHKEGEMV